MRGHSPFITIILSFSMVIALNQEQSLHVCVNEEKPVLLYLSDQGLDKVCVYNAAFSKGYEAIFKGSYVKSVAISCYLYTAGLMFFQPRKT